MFIYLARVKAVDLIDIEEIQSQGYLVPICLSAHPLVKDFSCEEQGKCLVQLEFLFMIKKINTTLHEGK